MSNAAAAAQGGAQGGEGNGNAGSAGGSSSGTSQTDILGGGQAGGSGQGGASSGNAGGTSGKEGKSGQSQGEATWRDALPEEMRNEPSLRIINDIPNLAKSYINAQKMIGADKIPVPNPKTATKEDWENVYRKLGRPETPDGYEVKVEGADEKFLGEFKKTAHTLGMLPNQVGELAKWFNSIQTNAKSEMTKQAEAERASWGETLRKEWGDGFGKEAYTAKLALETFDKSGTLTKFINENKLNNHPAIVKFMNAVGKTLKEAQFDGASGNGFGMTPAEIDSKIKALQADPAYMNRQHPNHQSVLDEISKLFEKRFAG